MTVKEEFDWYTTKQDEIVAGHVNEFAIIKDHSVLGYYKTIDEAIGGAKGLQPGTFMLMDCKPKGEDILNFYYRELTF